jgi:hypothetical protein
MPATRVSAISDVCAASLASDDKKMADPHLRAHALSTLTGLVLA